MGVEWIDDGNGNGDGGERVKCLGRLFGSGFTSKSVENRDGLGR